MELGLMVEPQAGGTYRRLLELARWAEDRNLDAFARSDHYLDGGRSDRATDALTTLAGLARDTSKIALLPMVAPLTFHHPSRLAKTAATIDEMSGGRFSLGVGTGWMEAEHEAFGLDFPDLRERFSRLFETLAYLRAAFSGSDGFQGRHYRLAAIDVLPRPSAMRLVVGGSGMHKTPRLAGRFADEYNMFACDEETLRKRRDTMEAAAGETGRDAASIMVSFAAPVIIAATEAGFEEEVERRATRAGIGVDEYTARVEGRNFLTGTPQRAAETMHRIEALGVDRIYLQRYCHLDDVDTELLDELLASYRS